MVFFISLRVHIFATTWSRTLYDPHVRTLNSEATQPGGGAGGQQHWTDQRVLGLDQDYDDALDPPAKVTCIRGDSSLFAKFLAMLPEPGPGIYRIK